MSVLYFAKVNYNSGIYEVYDEKKVIQEVNNKIFSFLTDKARAEKTELKKDDEGKVLPKTIIYEFLNLEKNNNIIIGNIIKNDHVYLKKIDRETAEPIKRKEENEESILFYYDVNKEIIVFYTTQKFGYLEFIEAFEELLNESFELNGAEEIFSIGLIKNLSSINTLIEDIKKLGKIKELKIEVIPPNPNEKLLNDMMARSERTLENMKNSNITKRSILFTSDTKDGINMNSDMVTDSINDFKYLHKDLKAEDVINNAYGEITATSKDGKIYTSKNTEPLKYEIKDCEKNRKKFKEIIGAIISYVLR